MRHWQAAVLVIACALAVVSASALARDVRFPAENACPDVAQRPDRDPTLRQQIAHTARGDIAYYRFGHGSPVVLQTGYRATAAEWDAAFLAAADTLIVGGADDVVLPGQNSDALVGLITGSRLAAVALAGDAMMYQYPGALAALIDGFIEQTDRSRSPMPVGGAVPLATRATRRCVDAPGHQRDQ